MSDETAAGPAAEHTSRGELLDRVADWLMEQALGGAELEELLSGCALRLVGAGVPVGRAHASFRTLHPLFASMSVTWTARGGVRTTAHEHGSESGSGWLTSPLRWMIDNGVPDLRRRLDGPGPDPEFPVLAELRDEGYTDYAGYLVPFASGPDALRDIQAGVAGSWACDRPGGYEGWHLQALARVQQRLAVAFKVRIEGQIAANVIGAYLGDDAGRRVLAGQIRRGDVETLHAAIWYSDMRASTRLADGLSPEAFLAALNGYFECAAGAVLDHGGEVLRFIGDAVLGIFPLRGGAPREACASALSAAGEARARLDALNRERSAAGDEPLDFGLALHFGDLMFGNIGVPRRLEFSVVGPVANEVARLEALTKTAGRPVLVSGEFAAHLDLPWERLGAHALRGVGATLEVLTPPA